MNNSNHIAAIAELAESERIFTTAQAERLGIPRDALHDAARSKRVERVQRGAYRLVGSGASETDELAALWKLTAPPRFTHERARVSEWDGIAVGGSTAAALLGIGNFYLSPYRIYVSRRINTRNPSVRFGVRNVAREDVTFERGIPVTKLERTVFDLVADSEDPSLVADVLCDAVHKNEDFDFEHLGSLLARKYGEDKARWIYSKLLANSGVLQERTK